MAKLLEKGKKEGLKGDIVTYVDRAVGQYFYREKVEGEKRYRSKLIAGASTMEQAKAGAIEAAMHLRTEDPHHHSTLIKVPTAIIQKGETPDELTVLEREEKLQKRKEKFEKIKQKKAQSKFINSTDAVDGWIKVQRKRVRAGSLEENSYSHKEIILRVHLKGYLEHKKITRTSQINKQTFDDYLLFRSNTTRINQSREISVISEWIRDYLMDNEYISDTNWIKKSWMPRVIVRQIDRMANPAINPSDWQEILKYVRGPWLKEANAKSLPYHSEQRRYFRYLFWHWILVAKSSGMSPEEICKLKVKNVEIRDVGRISQSKAQEEIEEIQAAGIDIKDLDDEFDPSAWATNEDEIGREERLIAYINTIRNKTCEAREIPTNLGKVFKRLMKFQVEFLKEKGFNYTIKPDSYVFFNPYNGYKPINQARIGQNWRTIREHLTNKGLLKGHKFSDKPYTLYSCRSSFVEDHLLRGTDIFLLARMAGHDVKTLQQSYERMDIRERSKEITDIKYGKKKEEAKVVDLAADLQDHSL